MKHLVPALFLLAAAAPMPVGSLLDALKAAPDAMRAQGLELRIIEAWHDQATQAVQVLEDHALAEIHGGKFREALADSDATLVLQPDIAELWRRRAEIRFILNDDEGAFNDLAQALTREKRDFPALSAISRFAEARHDNARALEAWKRFLELDPKAPEGQKRLQALEQKVQGRAL